MNRVMVVVTVLPVVMTKNGILSLMIETNIHDTQKK